MKTDNKTTGFVSPERLTGHCPGANLSGTWSVLVHACVCVCMCSMCGCVHMQCCVCLCAMPPLWLNTLVRLESADGVLGHGIKPLPLVDDEERTRIQTRQRVPTGCSFTDCDCHLPNPLLFQSNFVRGTDRLCPSSRAEYNCKPSGTKARSTDKQRFVTGFA